MVFRHLPPRALFAAAALAALAAPPAARAQQTLVAPNSVAEDANGNQAIFDNADVTYQVYLDESQLTAITRPSLITSLSFRLAAGEATAFPATAITFASYSIQFSRASTTIRSAGQFADDPTTTTFSANQAGTVTTVRSGALTIPAGSFTSAEDAGVPNSFGFTIAFSTPYLYTPGQEILYTIRHSGYTTADGSFVNPAIFASVPEQSTQVADALFASGLATTNPEGFDSVAIGRLGFMVVPEPGAGALLLVGGLWAARKCRRA